MNAVDAINANDLSLPSPIHLDPPSSPPLMNLPLPPFIPPPFIGNSAMNVPFMPPPPLVQIPNELRGKQYFHSIYFLLQNNYIKFM